MLQRRERRGVKDVPAPEPLDFTLALLEKIDRALNLYPFFWGNHQKGQGC